MNSTRHAAGTGLLLLLLAVAGLALPAFAQKAAAGHRQPGILLESLSWDEAERVLTPDRVVVIPLGAEAKEHGRHLQLNNDWIEAEYLKRRVLAAAPVVVAPTINYSYFPAFLEYPGSTSLESGTARDMVVEICRSLARYGPRRFYILNTGVSTLRPLSEAAAVLRAEKITLAYFDWDETDAVEKQVEQQPYGSHADEIETSEMLYLAPATVRMAKAVKDLSPDRPGPLTRNPHATTGVYSPSGAWGDPTLATRAKGRILVEATVKIILSDIAKLQDVP